MARSEDLPDVDKSEIAITLKKVAPVLGIDGTCYQIMDILLGLTKAPDWCGDRRPVVAISNAKLAAYTSRSQRTVTRCLKRLVEAGILAYKDSPTGRRYVYRGENGMPGEAYGLDFTPSRLRLAEFKQMARRFQLDLAQMREAKKSVTRLSRAITDLAALLERDEALSLHQRLDEILTSTIAITEQAEALDLLYLDCLDLVSASDENENSSYMSCAGDISDQQYTNTTQDSLYVSNIKRTHSNECGTNILPDDGINAAEKALQSKPRGTARMPSQAFPLEVKSYDPQEQEAKSSPVRKLDTKRPASAHEGGLKSLSHLSIGLLQSACSEVQALLGAQFSSWTQIFDQAQSMRLMIGLSESAWHEAVEKLGLAPAAAILATVTEKALRDPGQISKPGGYFRAMVERGLEGKLHLERSLFGLVESHLEGQKQS